MDTLFDYIWLFLLGFVLGCTIAASADDSSELKKELCKYEIEYCSKEELLKRMKDK